jgi:hypothetical protein
MRHARRLAPSLLLLWLLLLLLLEALLLQCCCQLQNICRLQCCTSSNPVRAVFIAVRLAPLACTMQSMIAAERLRMLWVGHHLGHHLIQLLLLDGISSTMLHCCIINMLPPLASAGC